MALSDIPADVFEHHIVGFISSIPTLIVCSMVCSKWRKISKKILLKMLDSGSPFNTTYLLSKVSLSQLSFTDEPTPQQLKWFQNTLKYPQQYSQSISMWTLLLVGDEKMGKTSLIRRLVSNSFEELYLPSDSIVRSAYNVGREQLEIWENHIERFSTAG
jgi:hypothetical protein